MKTSFKLFYRKKKTKDTLTAQRLPPGTIVSGVPSSRGCSKQTTCGLGSKMLRHLFKNGPTTLISSSSNSNSNSNSNGGNNHKKKRFFAVCSLFVVSFVSCLSSAKIFLPKSVVKKTHPTVSSGNGAIDVGQLIVPQQPVSVVPDSGLVQEESEKNETIAVHAKQAQADSTISAEEVQKVQSILPENETNALLSNQENESAAAAATTTTRTTLALLPNQPDLSLTSVLERVIQGPSSLNPLLNCSATSQVRIVSVNNETDHYWMLQSLDVNGQEKTVGGDEFYVSFLDTAYMNISYSDGGGYHPTAVAFVRDQGDGTYRLDFVTSPFNYDPNKALMGHGLLMVAFQYTCGIGYMTNHSKNSWTHGGTSGSTPTLRFLNTTVSQAPPLRIFQKPSTVALNNFSNVHVFGDSTMCQFVGTVWDNTVHSHRDNNYTNLCHCTKQLDFVIHSGSALPAVNGIANGVFNGGKKMTNEASTALIMGAGAWDLIRNPYPLLLEAPAYGHLLACQMMIERIREQFPNITLIWRSPTAMHIHVVKLGKLNQHAVAQRVRYLSTSRVERLYLQQKALMEKLNVTFLDVYEATYLSADYTQSSDALHYTPEANARMLSWLYPNYY